MANTEGKNARGEPRSAKELADAPVVARPAVYDPNNLLNYLLQHRGLKNDAALSRWLQLAPPVISKLRHREREVSASMLICVHDQTGIPVRTLRDLMGDRRAKWRFGERVAKRRSVHA
jgi:hypothetical protein